MIKNNNVFQWNKEQNDAFEELKRVISKSVKLQYFDNNKQVTLSVDASKSGLGAVILQAGRPCAFASRAMSESQIWFAQIEKELLAICFGVQKFHEYVYGREIL